jgi:phospholipase D1/2
MGAHRAAASLRAEAPLLRPGHNVWRVARAGRAAVLVDAAAYFGALRAAMLRAKRSIIVLAWDLDSRTPFHGEDGATDGLPESFAGFLNALIQRHPALEVRLLLWDYPVLYALERELFPARSLALCTPDRVHLCHDDVLPIGSSHHQKLVVIDDAVAFSGGLDVTIRRWDRPAHALDEPRRCDPVGLPYPPFHDVQVMVDGPAAAALGELARGRWTAAAGERLSPPAVPDDAWPAEIAPQFRDVTVGIARTMPPHDLQRPVREVETLFHDMLQSAERSIYVENQFISSTKIAATLIERLRQRPHLEAVIVTPRTHNGWLEHRVMLTGRIRFAQMLGEAGVADRVRMLYPLVTDGDRDAAVMVHSKLMVIDDRLLRIGSANLCNRSMGADTECDLVIEARTPAEQQAITRQRDQLIAEHCGATLEEVEQAMRDTGSLLATLDRLAGRAHQLRPIEDGEIAPDALAGIESIGDPEGPIPAAEYLDKVVRVPARSSRIAPAVAASLAGIAVILLVLAWRYTPLAELADAGLLAESLEAITAGPWAVAAALGLFIVGGLIACPVTVLIAGTAAAFGTWLGLAVAATGAMASALLTYAIGRGVGAEPLRRLAGRRVERVTRSIAEHGIPAITAVRLLPIAPFTVINLVAGAARVPLTDYTIGTLLGLAPGLLVMSALGRQILEVARDPSPGRLLLFGTLVLLWFGMACLLQLVVKRYRRRIR